MIGNKTFIDVKCAVCGNDLVFETKKNGAMAWVADDVILFSITPCPVCLAQQELEVRDSYERVA